LQGPGELAVADVDGDDLAGPGAEQDVGEAPGGGTGVEAPTALHGESEGTEVLEGAGQLVTTPGDVVRSLGVLAHDQRDVRGDPGGRLGGGRAGDRDPPGGDQLGGVLARTSQLPSDQLCVES